MANEDTRKAAQREVERRLAPLRRSVETPIKEENRPAAPVEGLENSGFQSLDGETWVRRSRAEAIIAAKDATLQDAIECVKALTDDKNKLETQLAAARKFIQFCADGFFVTDAELQGAAEAALEDKS